MGNGIGKLILRSKASLRSSSRQRLRGYFLSLTFFEHDTFATSHHSSTILEIPFQLSRYNDSHVGTTSGEAAVTGGAYLLFYRRANGALRWGGMEAQMMQQPKHSG